jgi:hypothetical protein
MATAHVFIVDTNTFKYHLEYMFAGTGAGNSVIDFNNVPITNLHTQTENNLVGMIADLNRIKVGDNIIFYLQQDTNNNIEEGKFYGIFKVSNIGFLDNLIHSIVSNVNCRKRYNIKLKNNENFVFKSSTNHRTIEMTGFFEQEKILEKITFQTDKINIEQIINNYFNSNQYLLKELQKSLTFRILIEPNDVYSDGITEWEALDDISNIQAPNQMLWSLIYRKLKGNRGNTMITIYEYERLKQLIRNKNQTRTLQGNNFTFNVQTQQIDILQQSNQYSGRQTNINILPRLIDKYSRSLQFETHLQAYILQRIANINIFQNETVEWIGNEVSCGVGMQRIDILLSVLRNNNKICIPIELKSTEAYLKITNQVQRYLDWLKQYYLPNRPSDLEPMIISRQIQNKTTQNYLDLLQEFNNFNAQNNLRLRYVEFNVVNQDINFQEVIY